MFFFVMRNFMHAWSALLTVQAQYSRVWFIKAAAFAEQLCSHSWGFHILLILSKCNALYHGVYYFKVLWVYWPLFDRDNIETGREVGDEMWQRFTRKGMNSEQPRRCHMNAIKCFQSKVKPANTHFLQKSDFYRASKKWNKWSTNIRELKGIYSLKKYSNRILGLALLECFWCFIENWKCTS